MMKKILIPLILVTLLLNACAPADNGPVATMPPDTDQPSVSNETATPLADFPTPARSTLQRGNAYLDSTELLTLESYPLQFTLVLKGSLPTPCNDLRVDMKPPDAENRIDVDVYSESNPDRMCAQVLKPFEENFSLGSFPTGHYTLWVNGELVAEFDA